MVLARSAGGEREHENDEDHATADRKHRPIAPAGAAHVDLEGPVKISPPKTLPPPACAGGALTRRLQQPSITPRLSAGVPRDDSPPRPDLSFSVSVLRTRF